MQIMERHEGRKLSHQWVGLSESQNMTFLDAKKSRMPSWDGLITEMNSWRGIKARPRPATWADTKGCWALARVQVLHMVTYPRTGRADGPAEIAASPQPEYESCGLDRQQSGGRLWGQSGLSVEMK
ncbi:uncharacterized protein ACB058_014540 isoform 2-T2 [Synchiropus picturatus]